MNRVRNKNVLTHDVSDHQDDLDKEISMLFRESDRLQFDDEDSLFDFIDPKNEIWNTFPKFGFENISESDSEDFSSIFDQDIQDPTGNDRTAHLLKDINIEAIPGRSVSPPPKRFRLSSKSNSTQIPPRFEGNLPTNNIPISSKTFMSPESFHEQHKEALSKLVNSMKRSAFSRNLIIQQKIKVYAFHQKISSQLFKESF